MLRVIRFVERRIPRFMRPQATLRGRMRTLKFRGLSEVFTCDGNWDIVANGLRFEPSTAPAFVAGTFDFSAALPPRRGTPDEREDWASCLQTYRLVWQWTAELFASWLGPDLEDRIPELARAELSDCRSWVYPIEHFEDELRNSYWSLGLAGIDEEILYYSGSGTSFNCHSEGWHVPGLGPTNGHKPKRPYPFGSVVIDRVVTWLSPLDTHPPMRNETVLPFTGKERIDD